MKAHDAIRNTTFDECAIDLSSDKLDELPASLRTEEGHGIDHRLNSQEYTTAAIFDAEAAALTAVRRANAPFHHEQEHRSRTGRTRHHGKI